MSYPKIASTQPFCVNHQNKMLEKRQKFQFSATVTFTVLRNKAKS